MRSPSSSPDHPRHDDRWRAPRARRQTFAPWRLASRRSSGYFPIAVWLQSPSNAERYRAIGINTYVGLWRGPTEEQLDALDKAGIRLICGQDERSLRFRDRLDDRRSWMHGDEPGQRPIARVGEGLWAADPCLQDRRGVREDPKGRSRSSRAASSTWARAWPGGWLLRARACGRTIRRITGNTSRAATSPRSTSTWPVTPTRRSPGTSGTCPRGSIAPSNGGKAERTCGLASRRRGSTTRAAGRLLGRSGRKSGWR